MKKRAGKSPSRATRSQASVGTEKRAVPPQAGSSADIAGRILAAVRKIPRGHVSTYGDIADVAGLPRRARLVGTVLRQSPSSQTLPWFRVINASGRISFPVGSDAYKTQRTKLEAEGIVFIGGRVNLAKHGWPQREAQLDELLWKMD